MNYHAFAIVMLNWILITGFFIFKYPLPIFDIAFLFLIGIGQHFLWYLIDKNN